MIQAASSSAWKIERRRDEAALVSSAGRPAMEGIGNMALLAAREVV
jgi:hypothetical protein